MTVSEMAIQGQPANVLDRAVQTQSEERQALLNESALAFRAFAESVKRTSQREIEQALQSS
jgi:hypothetical protein